MITLGVAAPAWAADVDSLWHLLDGGKPAQADTQARDTLPPDYAKRDLIMGVAAAEAGRGAESVLLLRCDLESHPEHPQIPRARLELSRAYLQTGQLDATQTVFDSMLAEEPPEPVVQNIRLAQAAIAKEKVGRRPRYFGYEDEAVDNVSCINAFIKSTVVNQVAGRHLGPVQCPRYLATPSILPSST